MSVAARASTTTRPTPNRAAASVLPTLPQVRLVPGVKQYADLTHSWYGIERNLQLLCGLALNADKDTGHVASWTGFAGCKAHPNRIVQADADNRRR